MLHPPPRASPSPCILCPCWGLLSHTSSHPSHRGASQISKDAPTPGQAKSVTPRVLRGSQVLAGSRGSHQGSQPPLGFPAQEPGGQEHLVLSAGWKGDVTHRRSQWATEPGLLPHIVGSPTPGEPPVLKVAWDKLGLRGLLGCWKLRALWGV